MKKFISGVAIGYILSETMAVYRTGFFGRSGKMFKQIISSAQAGETINLQSMVDYVAYGDIAKKTSGISDEQFQTDSSEWFEQAKRIRAMRDEGYSKEEIAEATGFDPKTISAVFFASEDKFYRVTFNGAQHEVVLLALQQLSPDDEESEALIEAAIRALIDTTERIEP